MHPPAAKNETSVVGILNSEGILIWHYLSVIFSDSFQQKQT
jgi:hypothetical protein